MDPVLGNQLYDDIFIWYCCIIGIIGNSLTCYLLMRRLSKFKNKIIEDKNINASQQQNQQQQLLPSTSSSISNENTIFVNKRLLIDLKNNWTIYSYFIGINIADIVVLLSWIMSKININVRAVQNLTFNASYSSNESAFLPYETYSNFMNLYNPKILNNSLTLFKETNSASPSENFYVSLETIIANLNNKIDYFRIKLIDIQGICQLYYYLTIISLHGSFTYTLACILDRLVKLKEINKEINAYKNNTNPYHKLVISASMNSNKKKNEKAKTLHHKDKTVLAQDKPRSATTVIHMKAQNKHDADASDDGEEKKNFVKTKKSKLKILSQNFKHLTKSNHSDIVKQLFGKTSVIFIGMFVMFLYFHLLWICGTIYDESVAREDFSFRIYAKKQVNFNGHTIDENYNSYRNSTGSFKLTSLNPSCQILNLRNYLPLFVMALDLFILLLIASLNLILIIVLICKYKKREKPTQTSKSIEKTNINKNVIQKYYLIKCIAYISIFTALFATPSVIARNILMIILTITNIKSSYQQSEQAQSGNNVDLNYTGTSQDIYYLNQTNITDFSQQADFNSNQGYSGEAVWIEFLNILCSKLDFFLLIASSHKFFIFLFKCYLIKLPCWNCIKSKFKPKTESI